MHTELCNDGLEYWPEGAPTEIDVATLGTAGTVTNPKRIPGVGQWLGFWGPAFSGLRVGFSATQSYPVINGLAVPYPKDCDGEQGFDLYLSRDTGGVGLVTIARFKTEAAARAWGGTPTPNTSASSGEASLPNRSLGTRDTVAAGVIAHTWSQPGFLFALLVAAPTNAADLVYGGFHLRAGASIAGFVGTASTGFSMTGSNGDLLDIVEFGRV